MVHREVSRQRTDETMFPVANRQFPILEGEIGALRLGSGQVCEFRFKILGQVWVDKLRGLVILSG